MIVVELEQMLMKNNINLETIAGSTFSEPWASGDNEREPQLWRHIGSGSGGYADHIFRYAAKELFDIDNDKIEFKQLR